MTASRTSRRGFLGAMLAVCAAPAIVRAESLMRLTVPPQEPAIPDAPKGWGRSAGGILIHGGAGALVAGDLLTISGLPGTFVVTAVNGRQQEFQVSPWPM